MSVARAELSPSPSRPPAQRPVRSVGRPGSRRAASQAPRLRYVVGTLAGLFAILMGQLVLSIALGNGAYEIRDLERQLAERNRDLSIVSEEVSQLQDPQTLAQLAVTLGMVDDGDPAYLRLSDASVLGSTEPAAPGTMTLVSVVPGELSQRAVTTAQVVSSQPSAQGESLPAFAALEDHTGDMVAPGDALDGVPALVPDITPSQPATAVGGDLPAPVTR